MKIKLSIAFAILTLCVFLQASLTTIQAQQRVTFKNKKLSELNTSWYPSTEMGNGGLPHTFPAIWSTFSSDNDDFVFSGYYTVNGKNEEGLPIVNGPVMLERIRMFAEEEGAVHYKEVLSFNINSNMSDMDSGNFGLKGAIDYAWYWVYSEDEEEPTDIDNNSWKPYIKIHASYNDFGYRNISYTQKDWNDEITYTIVQQQSYTLNIDYFTTITTINTAEPEFKPIFRVVRQ